MRCALILLVLGGGCATTRSTVDWTPLRTPFPVSASDQFVQPGGSIVTRAQLQPVGTLRIHRRIVTPRHESVTTALHIEDELVRQVAVVGGHGVANLRLQALEYDPGDHRPAAAWKIMGWLWLTSAAAIGAAGLAADSQDVGSDVAYGLAGSMAALGLLSFGIAALLQEPTHWDVAVDGVVVRRVR